MSGLHWLRTDSTGSQIATERSCFPCPLGIVSKGDSKILEYYPRLYHKKAGSWL